MDSQKVTKKPHTRSGFHGQAAGCDDWRMDLARTHSTPPGSVVHVRDPRGMRDLPLEKGRRAEDYEFQIITVPRRTSVSSVRASLTEESEYGRWELARTRIYLGGAKKMWMRRRIIRVRSTLARPPQV